jgi:hypothetical protein
MIGDWFENRDLQVSITQRIIEVQVFVDGDVRTTRTQRPHARPDSHRNLLLKARGVSSPVIQ